jgi:hypothetical protein
LLTAIRNRLKTGTINNIVLFADSDKLPPPPYVVIKPERGPTGNRNIRIIVHMIPGEQDRLENYIFCELSDHLLEDQVDWLIDRHGNHGLLINSGDWTDTIADNDDKTISMERIFILPHRVH